jgi:hypothetical protein
LLVIAAGCIVRISRKAKQTFQNMKPATDRCKEPDGPRTRE